MSKDKPQTIRQKIHEVIFGAHTPLGLTFDVLLLLAIVLSVIFNSLETVVTVSKVWHDQLMIAKWSFTILFTIEFLLRIYCVNKPFRYIFSFWGIVDLLAILPDYLLLMNGAGNRSFSVIRSLRLLRVFRIMNLAWFQHEGEDLGNAIWRARGKIIVFLMVVMIIVTVSGTLMYEVEHNWGEPETSDFTSIPNGIYWSIVTMTTVGFGDIVPVTTTGKILSAILILLGYSLIIVPTGFVSAEVIEAKNSRKLISTISCASCVSEGHAEDATYCKYCGEKL